MESVLQAIEQNAETYVGRLAEAVAIPSVSATPSLRSEVIRMSRYVQDWIVRLGGTCTCTPLGPQTLPDGTIIELPPVLLGQIGSDRSKRTVCIYGHYDVQPALAKDGWDTEPFQLTERDGKLYGRGATDDKGPLLAWLWAIEALQKQGVALPVNVKMVFEGMEESGSLGLDAVIVREARGFLADVDFFCISDSTRAPHQRRPPRPGGTAP